MEKNKKNTVAVIGAGPSGITACIYLARAGYFVDVFEKLMPGGKVNLTATVENYPGFTSITGPDLAMHFYEQMQDDMVNYINDKVLSITQQENEFVVQVEDKAYHYHAVIIATGTKERKLEVLKAEQFENRGISYCAVCDGPLYKNKDVVVIGGGNAALEEALYLATFCSSVTLIHRRDTFRADEVLQSRVKKSNIITFMNSQVVELLGEEKLEGVIIENQVTKEKIKLKVQALFPYIGQEANTTFLSSLHILDEKGYIEVDANKKTSIPGLLAAGDVIKKDLRQIVTATSDGAIAAMSAIQYMKENDF